MITATVSAARLTALLDGLPAGRPAYARLAEAVRSLIVDGRIELGARLPSERDLAEALGASRTTVTRAYDLLRERGFLASRRGSGSVAMLPVPGGASPSAGILRPYEEGDDEGIIDLTCAALRAPVGIEDAYQTALEVLPRYLAGAGYTTVGLPELRAALAEQYAARGLATNPDQILITSGAVTATLLAVRSLVQPGQRVLIEDPTFPNTAAALRSAGLRLTPAPVEPRGWDVDHVASVIRRGRPSVAVLIPDFHNPTGALMSDADRHVLAEAMASASTTAVVDETVCSIVLDPVAMPAPMGAHAPSAISVGSSSKSHWGGLRTGWIRTPGPVGDALIAQRVAGDGGAALLEQLVLLHLLRTDRVDADRERLADLRLARDAAVAALRDRLPDARFVVPVGGLSLWVELPGLSAGDVALHARERGLLLAAGPRFAIGRGLGSFLRLPYVQPPAVMADAVARLAGAVEDVRRGAPTSARPGLTPLVA